MYTAVDLAKYVITRLHSLNKTASSMYVDAILMHCFKDYYLQTGELLFNEEIMFSVYPRIRSVFNRFSCFGGCNICLLSTEEIICPKKDVVQLIDVYTDKELWNLIDDLKLYYRFLPANKDYNSHDLATYIASVSNYTDKSRESVLRRLRNN